jgi:hypothetical protein
MDSAGNLSQTTDDTTTAIVVPTTSNLAYPGPESSDMVLSGHQCDEQEIPLSEDPPQRPTRVRFRSRVRITSGLHRYRNSEQDCGSFTPASSISGSASSSISAPLRTQAEDEAGKPGWGTLGQRVSILARGKADRRLKFHRHRERIRELQSHRGIIPGDNDGLLANERTPLSGSSLPYSYLHGEIVNREMFNSVENEAEVLANEIDLVFGRWPNRLFNHHVRFLSSVKRSLSFQADGIYYSVVVVAHGTACMLPMPDRIR